MEKVEKKSKVKKIFAIVRNVIFYIFLALCVFAVVVSLASKKDSTGAVSVFGHQMLFVQSDSMGKSEFTDVSDFDIGSIPVRSMVLIETVPEDPEAAAKWYDDIEIGDVLTIRYTYTTQETITHRVTSITEKEDGGFIIQLAGDNKSAVNGQLYQTIDTSIPYNTNYVIGKVVGQSYAFGVVMTFLQQPFAIVLMIILPCFIIIIGEVVKILKYVNAEKKKNEQDEMSEKERELEELRRKLAALETQTKQAPCPSDETKDEDET